MNAARAIADRPTPPDPAPDRSAGAASVPPGIARLLTVLHWIIAHGQQLALKVQQRAAGADLADLARRYRTRDFGVILARLRRGLMLAAGLQGRLVSRAATGRDVLPVPARCSTGGGRRSQPAKQRATRRTNIVDLPLDRLPTAEEIASELRRRPIGAVLADICRDLGIMPSDLPRELGRELTDLVTDYGGSLAVLLFKEASNHAKRLLAAAAQRPQAAAPLRAPATPVLQLAGATGPP